MPGNIGWPGNNNNGNKVCSIGLGLFLPLCLLPLGALPSGPGWHFTHSVAKTDGGLYLPASGRTRKDVPTKVSPLGLSTQHCGETIVQRSHACKHSSHLNTSANGTSSATSANAAGRRPALAAILLSQPPATRRPVQPCVFEPKQCAMPLPSPPIFLSLFPLSLRPPANNSPRHWVLSVSYRANSSKGFCQKHSDNDDVRKGTQNHPNTRVTQISATPIPFAASPLNCAAPFPPKAVPTCANYRDSDR